MSEAYGGIEPFPSTSLISIRQSADKTKVKPWFLAVLSATVATAGSHPGWWAYTSPDATAVVGIEWNNLRDAPFAPVIQAQISPTGPLGFPDLDCLRQAREIVVSSPALLAVETGSFPTAMVQDQAQRRGLRRSVYRGMTLWLPPQADKPGVAQIDERLVLVGARKTLESAVDHGLEEAGGELGHRDSPLLTRAEFIAQTGDLWVAAVKLPDPLAGRFMPLDIRGSEFLGQVSLRDGLVVQASFDAGSVEAAAKIVRNLGEKTPSFPALAQGLQTAADQSRVTIALQVSSADLAAAPQPSPAPAPSFEIAAGPLVKPTPALKPAPPRGSAQPQASAGPQPTAGTQTAETANLAEPEPSETPFVFVVTHVEEIAPRIIRILNLDGGPREIVLPLIR